MVKAKQGRSRPCRQPAGGDFAPLAAAYDTLTDRLAELSERDDFCEDEARAIAEAIESVVEAIRRDPARSPDAMRLRARVLLGILPEDYDDDITAMARRLAFDVLGSNEPARGRKTGA